MSKLIAIDGAMGEGGGQILRRVQGEEEGVVGIGEEAASGGVAGEGAVERGQLAEGGAPGFAETAPVAIMARQGMRLQGVAGGPGEVRLLRPRGGEGIRETEAPEVAPAAGAQGPGPFAEDGGDILPPRPQGPPVEGGDEIGQQGVVGAGEHPGEAGAEAAPELRGRLAGAQQDRTVRRHPEREQPDAVERQGGDQGAGLGRPLARAAGLQQGGHHVAAAGHGSQQRTQLPGVEVEPQAHDLHRRRLRHRQPQVIEGVAQAGAHGVAQQGDPEVGEGRHRPGQQQGAAVDRPLSGTVVQQDLRASAVPGPMIAAVCHG